MNWCGTPLGIASTSPSESLCGLPPRERLRTQLAGADLARLHHLAAGHDGRRALDDVHHVDDVLVVLDLARAARAGRRRSCSPPVSSSSPPCLNLSLSRRWRRRRRRSRVPLDRAAASAAFAPIPASSLSSSAEVAPLTPIAPITVAIEVDRDAALQRHGARQVQRGGPAAGGLVLEVLARTAVDRRGAGLVGGHVDARHLRRVGPQQVDQLAAGVDHGDHRRDAALGRHRARRLGRESRALVRERRHCGGREPRLGARDRDGLVLVRRLAARADRADHLAVRP